MTGFKFLVTIFLSSFITLSSAQELTQTVKGNVTDVITGAPLAKTSVSIENNGQNFVTQTNESGHFTIAVPTGRYKIKFSYTGYSSIEQELLVIAGRESVIDLALRPSTHELQSVEVSATGSDNLLSGSQTLTIEKTLRHPANFFDPVRAITSYPGVVTTNDQNNSIIIRGNSPNGLLWRLNGADIVNPNHLANAGTLSDRPAANGGGVNILSAQMLDKTQFFTGTFPVNYGNALSGIIDMSLRDGNKDKFEYTAQASLIGLDFSAEGPVGKNKNTSFLANYRYSTVGLLSGLGVNFGDEEIKFQDLSFNLNSNLKNNGTFSLFGFWGGSSNVFERKDPSEWEEDKDKYDINYQAQTYAVGMNYQTPIANGKFTGAIGFSSNDQERQSMVSPDVVWFQRYLRSDDFNSGTQLVSSNFHFENQFSEPVAIDVGVMANYQQNDFAAAKIFQINPVSQDGTDIDFSNEGVLLQPYVNSIFTISPSLSVTTGLRYVTYSYNNSNSFEPRISASVATSKSSGLQLSYGLVSQLQLPQVYAYSDNDLGFTKSHHIDLGYHSTSETGLILKSNLFYQDLFDVPIENDLSSTFSVLNFLEGDLPTDLVNNGTGKNYGADITIEKQFYNEQYFLLGGSYYESKYTAGDQVERDTRFNGNYTFTGVYGKEWTRAKKNRTIGLNTRVLYLGGLRQSQVDLVASQEGETVYNTADPFNEKLKDYFRLDLRLSFRKNKVKYTRTFALDIQNLTGQENEAYQYFDFTQGKVLTKLQLGIIPVLVYRIDF